MPLENPHPYLTTAEGAFKLAAAVFSVAGFIYAAWKGFVKGFLDPRRARNLQIDSVLSQGNTANEKLDRVLHELFPNSGLSMRDAVNRIENGMKMVSAMQKSDFESREEIVVYTNAAGEITNVSSGYTELTGLSTLDAQHEGWKNAIFESDRDKVVEGWHDAVARRAVFVTQVRFVNEKSGMMRLCKSVAAPMMDDISGKCLGWSARIRPLSKPVPIPSEEMPDDEEEKIEIARAVVEAEMMHGRIVIPEDNGRRD